MACGLQRTSVRIQLALGDKVLRHEYLHPIAEPQPQTPGVGPTSRHNAGPQGERHAQMKSLEKRNSSQFPRWRFGFASAEIGFTTTHNYLGPTISESIFDFHGPKFWKGLGASRDQHLYWPDKKNRVSKLYPA